MSRSFASILAGLSQWRRIFGDEAFRLFFPLAALQGALWPFLWVAIGQMNLVGTNELPSSIWHAQEMVLGCYGAALIGFLLTAVPEWTDTKPLQGRPLFALALLWGTARLIGFFGFEFAIIIAALADAAWLCFLCVYIVRLSLRLKTDQLIGFLFWLGLLLVSSLVSRYGAMRLDYALAQKWSYISGFVFLGFLGLALARVTVAVTNLILDPAEESSPFRPHPGRKNLSAALVFVAICVEVVGFSDAVRGFVWIAAGAAFLDRVGEHFIGRAFFRLEILVLALSAVLSGVGLICFGMAKLALFALSPVAGLHLSLMGGLGLGVLAVFSIAGLLHTGRELPFPSHIAWAIVIFLIGVALRVGPDLDLFDHPLGIPYLVASLFWAGGFAIWLALYWPYLTDANSLGERRC